jgi:hypothetical protein
VYIRSFACRILLESIKANEEKWLSAPSSLSQRATFQTTEVREFRKSKKPPPRISIESR